MEKLLTLEITIFLLIATGFFARRLGLISEQGQKNLTDLVIYIVLPCNILKAFLGSGNEGVLSSFLGILLISVGIQIFCVIYSRLIYRRETEGRRICLEYATVCSNAGFLGNPIAEGVYGAEGLLLASIYLIPLRIMMWSEGLALYTGSKDLKKTLRRVLTHPCVIACFLGIILMALGLTLPPGLNDAVIAIGNCNTALSMMVIGMILAQIDLRDFWDPALLGFSLHRFIIIPAFVFFVCRFLPVSRTVAGVSVLLAAMPAGATTSILAEKYQVEPAFGTKLVIFSTLLSIPATAAWCFILR